MLLAATTVAIIERQFIRAAVWCIVAAALTLIGLMHSFEYGESDTSVLLLPPWSTVQGWVLGYLLMALCFFLARWLTVPDKGHH